MSPIPVVDADVCVVGCGPAGITLARELVAAGSRVVMVESGQLTDDPVAAELTEGRATGPVIKDYPTYLRDSRRFRVGGAGALWGRGARVWCIPFSAIDFAPRYWVSGSGWPLDLAELTPYATRAAAAMGIPPFEPPQRPPEAVGAAPESLVAHAYHYPVDSGVFRHQFQQLCRTERFRAELGATAMGLVTRGERVAAVQVRRTGGDEFLVAADGVVLAAGGIENARFLLLDDARRPGAVVADRSALGRYFMEHFHVYAARVRFPDAAPWRDYLTASTDAGSGAGRMRVLGLSDQAQRSLRLLNASLQLTADRPTGPAGPVECGLLIRSEQAPDPRSRVLLGEERDRLGRPRAVLDWQVSDQDWRSVVDAADVAVDALRTAYGATAELLVSHESPWPWRPAGPASSSRPTWGNHHMGTTRMHRDPAQGVVDADCRVHGTANLYVAGSSVFPTSGFANPTFTIVALAIRLADHLLWTAGGRPADS